MIVLNEKKMNGVNISKYMATLIRVAEGLPLPESDKKSMMINPVEQHQEQLRQKHNQELVDMVLDQLVSRGLLAQLGSPAMNEDKQANDATSQNTATLKELKSIASDLMNWDD